MNKSLTFALLRWIDSAGDSELWVDIQETDFAPVMITTVGLICKETDEFISITTSATDEGMASDFITIPKVAVVGDIKRFTIGPKLGVSKCN